MPTCMNNMKNILVPTDFSSCAQSAFETAVFWSQRIQAKIHLLHSVPLSIRTEWLLGEIEQTESALGSWRKQFPLADIETKYLVGNVIDSVTDYINTKGIDLIIMGSHGAGGKNEYFIGSNAQKVVRKVHCPVLVIKNTFQPHRLERVVFGSHFHPEEKQAFLKFKELMSSFMPEIHLVSIQTGFILDPQKQEMLQAMQSFQNLCAPNTCKVHFFEDLTVEQGIRRFSEGLKAGLIAISNHHRHPMKRIFTGSIVEALVNHADMPVLSVDYLN